jgi:hypothetical protein
MTLKRKDPDDEASASLNTDPNLKDSSSSNSKKRVENQGEEDMEGGAEGQLEEEGGRRVSQRRGKGQLSPSKRGDFEYQGSRTGGRKRGVEELEGGAGGGGPSGKIPRLSQRRAAPRRALADSQVFKIFAVPLKMGAPSRWEIEWPSRQLEVNLQVGSSSQLHCFKRAVAAEALDGDNGSWFAALDPQNVCILGGTKGSTRLEEGLDAARFADHVSQSDQPILVCLRLKAASSVQQQPPSSSGRTGGGKGRGGGSQKERKRQTAYLTPEAQGPGGDDDDVVDDENQGGSTGRLPPFCLGLGFRV